MQYGVPAHAVQNSDQCSAQMVYKAVHAPYVEKTIEKKLTTQVQPAPASLVVGLRP